MTAQTTSPDLDRQRLQRLVDTADVATLGAKVVDARTGALTLALEGRQSGQSVDNETAITSLGLLAARSACLAALPDGSEVSTIDLKLNFQHAAAGAPLHATAELVRQGRSIIAVRCDVVANPAQETLPVALIQASFLRT